MKHNHIYCGDVLEVLRREIPDESIDCWITSPPYYALRCYQTASWIGGDTSCNHVADASKTLVYGNPDFNEGRPSREATKLPGYYADICPKCGAVRQDQQIGLEASPEEYIEKMVIIGRELRRTLKPCGSLWLNLGDTYAGSGGAGGDHNPGGLREDVPKYRQAKQSLPSKNLMMIPFRVALALQTDGWILRSVVPWIKRNSKPDSTKDRPGISNEYFFLLTKGKNYYYNREKIKVGNGICQRKRKSAFRGQETIDDIITTGRYFRDNDLWLRSWQGLYDEEESPLALVVNPKGYKDFHYATFPRGIVEPLIAASTPEEICSKCGEPRWPIYKPTKDYESKLGTWTADIDADSSLRTTIGHQTHSKKHSCVSKYVFSHYENCGCAAPFIPSLIGDPFMGSGTVAIEAQAQERNWVGIELSEKYIDLAWDRIEREFGLFVRRKEVV